MARRCITLAKRLGHSLEVHVAARDVSHVLFCAAGVTQAFGTDLSKSMLGLSQNVGGPTGAALVAPVALASQGLSAGAGFVQAVLSAVIHIVPPLIPPPVWVNKPLPCAPMVSFWFLLAQPAC